VGRGAAHEDSGVIEAVLAAAASVTDVVAGQADAAEEQRRLPAETVAALVEAGLMRLCVPEKYGGPAVDPMTMVAAVETVARADGAAGWCAAIASTTSSMAAFLPVPVAERIYLPPGSVTGGVFAPNGSGVAVDGGYRVTGRWQWGSGTQHCQWITGGVRCDDDTFRLCFIPAEDVEFHDTWYTSGLRGTGSLDFSVSDVFVPLDYTFEPGRTRPVVDTPLAAFPNFALLASGIAAVALGIGRRAIDELAAMASGKHPQFSSRSLAEHPYTQIEIAKVDAGLRAGRSFLIESLAAAWQEASAGGSISVDRRVDIRLAGVHAVEAAVAATDTSYTLAGGSSLYSSHPLQRCLRDVHATTQHIMVAPKLYATLGRATLGLELDAGML
jgi:alkylation response protein AidB-like acyl-CoA dehydrogenase